MSPGAVGERLRHVAEQALADAAEIAERASALEDHVWESARRTHAEHRELLAATRERMARIVRDWDHRHRALDEAAARHRSQVTEDFELALALRRKEACHDVWLMEETARRRADQVVQEATRRAEVLLEHRDRVSDVLRVVHALLARPPDIRALRGEGTERYVAVQEAGGDERLRVERLRPLRSTGITGAPHGSRHSGIESLCPVGRSVRPWGS